MPPSTEPIPTKLRILGAAIALGLAACVGEKGPMPDCGLPSVASAPDTILRATLDGRQVLIGDSAHVYASWDTTSGGFAQLRAWTLTPGKQEQFYFYVRLHGVGAYPVGWRDPGDAGAMYWCLGNPFGQQYQAQRSPGDTLWITAIDTTTGVIDGEFHFTGIMHSYRAEWTDTLVVDGEFHGVRFYRYYPEPPSGDVARPGPS